jgi:hypothetical protein
MVIEKVEILGTRMDMDFMSVQTDVHRCGWETLEKEPQSNTAFSKHCYDLEMLLCSFIHQPNVRC